MNSYRFQILRKDNGNYFAATVYAVNLSCAYGKIEHHFNRYYFDYVKESDLQEIYNRMIIYGQTDIPIPDKFLTPSELRSLRKSERRKSRYRDRVISHRDF